MKLYHHQDLPNPRIARMVLAEKGIDIEKVSVDFTQGEHRQANYLKKNPDGLLPLLELDSGEYIAETQAIVRYIENAYSDIPLMGTTPEENARIEMWQCRIENGLFNPLTTYFHHGTEGLGDERYRNQDWGHHNLETAKQTLQRLDEQLADQRYIAGNQFSVADIIALSGIDFGIAVGAIEVPAEYKNLERWYNEVNQRASATA